MMDLSDNCLLICTDEAPQFLEGLLRRNLPNLHIRSAQNLKNAQRWLARCNMLMGDPSRVRTILPDLPRLQWVQSNYAGVAPLLEASCRRDYILTNVGPLYGPAMSEYVFCYLLLHERRAWQRLQAQMQRRWDGTYASSLRGKTIGLMGVGDSGARIAETAKHFGMHTRGLTRTSSGCPYIDVYYHSEHLLEFVAELDYLICALPETSQTRNLIDRTALEAMARRPLLVNVGRGSAIDDKALVEALENGWIAGAVLDVFREEPLPAHHPFWTAPNILLTCHTAAPGPGYNDDIVAIFAANYHRFIAGLPLMHVVDFERGY